MGYWTKVFRKILLLIFSIVAILLGFKLATFYMPFLIGFVISLIIEPLIKYIVKKTKINRKTSAVIVLLIIFSILIGLIVWATITIVSEASNLLQSLNIYIEQAYKLIESYINSLDFDKIKIPDQVISIVENSAGELLGLITRWITSFLTSILQGITSLPVIVIYVIITILSTYFICTDKLYILDQLEHHFPKIWVRKFGMHLKEIVSTLRKLFKSRINISWNIFYNYISRIIYF